MFQNVNRNFFHLKYEQRAQSFFKNLAELWKEKSGRNLECVSKQFKKVCYPSVIDHIHLMITMKFYILQHHTCETQNLNYIAHTNFVTPTNHSTCAVFSGQRLSHGQECQEILIQGKAHNQ